jgi:hypothetical protein
MLSPYYCIISQNIQVDSQSEVWGKSPLWRQFLFAVFFVCILSLNLAMLLLITRDLLMPTWWVDDGKFATCTRLACQPV